MELDGLEPLAENDILARHIKLAEVLEGKRSLDWFDLETLIYDSRCLTSLGKQVGIWSIAVLKEFLKDAFLQKAQSTPEILTVYPFFNIDFLPGVDNVPRVYAAVFRFALQLYLCRSLDRFGGILRSLRTNLEAVLWYHTHLQFEIASLAQQEGWQLQLEQPYNNGTKNKSDVSLSRGKIQYLIEAVSIRISESGRKKQAYYNWLSYMSIQYGINIVGRLGEPWFEGKQKEQQWVQEVQKVLFSVYRSGLIVTVYSPHGGSLEFSKAALSEGRNGKYIWCGCQRKSLEPYERNVTR